MFQYTIAQDIVPHLKISVETAPDAPSLSQIRMSVPLKALKNGMAADAFKNHLDSLYVLDVKDTPTMREYTLKPQGETWSSDPVSYTQRLAQHLSAYYHVPVESIFQKCADPALCDNLTRRRKSQEIVGNLRIVDDVTTEDVKVTIKSCPAQNDFCTWLGELYDTERTKGENGSVTLRLKKLRGTEDALSHVDHLVDLTQAITYAWACKPDEITANIYPPIAQQYCSNMLKHRSQTKAESERADEEYSKKIIVVGVGFSGVSEATQMLDRLRDAPPDKPFHVTLIERRPDDYFAAGIAYGAAGKEHRVNVDAMYMRLNPNDKEDMARWLKEASHKGHLGDAKILNVEDGLVIPGKDTQAADLNHVNIQRRLEHYYMLTRLFQKIEQTRTEDVADTYIAFTEAVDADDLPGQIVVYGADGQKIKGTDLVLSNGHGPVKPPAFLAAVHEKAPDRVVIDQWSPDHQAEKLLSDPTIKTVVVLGTGLSAMDEVMTAERVKFFEDPTRTLILDSRGKHTHPIKKEGQVYEEPKVDIDDLIRRLPKNVEGVPNFVQTVFTELQNQGEKTLKPPRAHTDEETFAALKETIPTLLKASGFEPRDLVPFLHKYSSVLTTKAVPMASIIGATFEHYRDLGRVQLLGATPETVEYNAPGYPGHPSDCMAIKITKDGKSETLYCGAIISALPPQSDPESVPLLNNLLVKGILSREKIVGSGVAADDHYRAIGRDGKPNPHVFLMGPVLSGKKWLEGDIGPYSQIAGPISEEGDVISRELVAGTHKKPQTLLPVLV